jgi:molecular chaperone GrpE (heat shock protein)
MNEDIDSPQFNNDTPDCVIADQSGLPSGGQENLQDLIAAHLADLRGLSHEALRHAYQELERCRKVGLNQLRPLFNEILLIRDDLTRLIGFYGQNDLVDPKDVIANLDGLRTELDELLSRRQIVPIQIMPGKFDRESQRAVLAIQTENPDENLNIVDEIRIGFHGPDGVLRRTDVSILRYNPASSLENKEIQ